MKTYIELNEKGQLVKACGIVKVSELRKRMLNSAYGKKATDKRGIDNG